jgi:hypothetical protein
VLHCGGFSRDMERLRGHRLKTYRLNNFTGGVNRGTPERIATNELSEMSGLVHIGGNLRTIGGKKLYNAAEILADTPVKSVTRFYKSGHRAGDAAPATKQGYTLAKCGVYVWLDVSSDDTGDFRPILKREGDKPTYPERFAEIGGALFMACAGDENLMQFYGDFYAVGTAKTTSGSAVLTGQACDWLHAAQDQDVAAYGDSVFLEKSAGVWVGPYKVLSVTDGTHINLISTVGVAEATGAFVRYIISRTHYVGMLPPQKPPVVTRGIGGSIAEGTYLYAFAMVNAFTGYVSNRSPEFEIKLSAGSKAAVTVPTDILSPEYHQATAVRVYRSKAFQTTLYELGDIAITPTAQSYTLVDNFTDTELGNAASDFNHIPPDVSDIIPWGYRPYAWGNEEQPHKVYYSSLNQPECWPIYDVSIDSPDDIPVTIGGEIVVGELGEKVVAAVPDANSFGRSGLEGSGLLIFTKNGSVVWHGNDINDFRRVLDGTVGCVSSRAADNCGGRVLWMSQNGPMMRLAAENLPVYEKFFPLASRPFWSVLPRSTSAADYGELCRSAHWRDWWIFAWPEVSTAYCDRLAMLHLPTMTYLQLPAVALADLCVWSGPGDNGEVLYSDGVTGYIWRLFEETTGQPLWGGSALPWSLKTGLLGAESYTIKTLKEVVLCFKRPAANQTVVVKAFKGGKTASNETAATLTLEALGEGDRVYKKAVFSNTAGRSIQVEVSGSATQHINLEWMEVRVTENAGSEGVDVG